MLNPLVYFKVVRARNAYLKAGNGERKAAKEHLLDIAGDRYWFYKFEERPNDAKLEGRPNDARRILKLATTKRNATDAEKARLMKIRKEMLDEPCLAEQPMTA